MDYLDFYGLNIEPFSSAPISKFYYNSAQHQRALVRLMYAVDTMKGLAALIGEIGTGKTTLARRMLDSLPEEEYESALLVIIHSGITADWLLSRIARQLGVEEPAPEKLKLLNQLYNRLVELHEQGKKAVVLIDEAQMLKSRELMEEFRGLLNLELPESKLITFVFFGLPELEESLQLDDPLAQRVALMCKLDRFTMESTVGYINHRLRLAGAKSQFFPQDSIKLVHHYARGIPRLINTICDNCLFEGYLLKKKVMEPDLIQAVATDLGLAPIPKPKRTAIRQPRPGTVIQAPDPMLHGRPNPPAQYAPGPTPPTVMPGRQPPQVPGANYPAYGDPEEETTEDLSIEPRAEPGPEAYAPEPENYPEGSELPPLPEEPPAMAPPDLEAPPPQDAQDGEIDAMFNEITSGEDKKEPPDEDNIDSLFDKLKD